YAQSLGWRDGFHRHRHGTTLPRSLLARSAIEVRGAAALAARLRPSGAVSGPAIAELRHRAGQDRRKWSGFSRRAGGSVRRPGSITPFLTPESCRYSALAGERVVDVQC